ncbi:MAG: B12-binding domain-containing radical SAM protein [Pseudomonadota bacterium]
MAGTRLLLIYPRTPPSFWGLEYSLELSQKLLASNAPLGLLTIAALTPPGWEVTLVDENVTPLEDLDQTCDVVGIGAMNIQAERAYELADAFRARGRTVVIGGPLAFMEPERAARHADVVVVGEAERTWPRFCEDYSSGAFAPTYIEREAVDLSLSPVPRYDLLTRGTYASIPIQTTRGCPHSCEFCDIIVMMGRRVRTKPVPQVLAEVEAVQRYTGHDSIFFTDDNFNGNLKYTRALCRALIEHRQHSGYAPLLFTQASISLAEQDELLELMVRAGFTRLFLGIETPRQDSLLEAGKRQNARGNLVERVSKLQRAGIVTWAGMIVGFDHDDVSIFEEQARFLDEAGIAMAMVGLLNAMPKTPLYDRLKRERRLVTTEHSGDNCTWTNIVPLRMSRAQLLGGYADLLEHLYAQQNFARRLMTNVMRMGPPLPGVSSSRFPNLPELQDFFRAVWRFTANRDARYRRHFVPNLLMAALRRRTRIVETAVHLGCWQHFDRYVPLIVDTLRSGAATEQALSHLLEAAEPEQVVLAAAAQMS